MADEFDRGDPMATMYGIPNCDTIKKARRWLDDHGIKYDFHDYKKAGIDENTLKQWCSELGHDALLNTRGTTWRKLDDSVKADIDEKKAIAIMMEHTSIIKRPVLDVGKGKKLLLGFDETAYKSLL